VGEARQPKASPPQLSRAASGAGRIGVYLRDLDVVLGSGPALVHPPRLGGSPVARQNPPKHRFEWAKPNKEFFGGLAAIPGMRERASAASPRNLGTHFQMNFRPA